MRSRLLSFGRLLNTARQGSVALLLCGLLVAVPMWAQSTGPHARHSHETSDEQFLKTAGASTLAAIDFSSAVKDRTPKVEVRAYAESVIAENHQIHQNLVHLASQRGVTLATGLNSQEQNHRAQLEKTSKANLDAQYARLMVSQDQATINQFRQETRDGVDPVVKEFARKTLPQLQGLLSQARQIADASSSRH